MKRHLYTLLKKMSAMLTTFIPQPTQQGIWYQHIRGAEGWALSVGSMPSFPTDSPPACLICSTSTYSYCTLCSMMRNPPLTLVGGARLSLPGSLTHELTISLHCSLTPRDGEGGSVSSWPLGDNIALPPSYKSLLPASCPTCSPTVSEWKLHSCLQLFASPCTA